MGITILRTSPKVAKKLIIFHFKNRQLNLYKKIEDLKKKNSWQDDNPALSILFESIEYHQVLIDTVEAAMFNLINYKVEER